MNPIVHKQIDEIPYDQEHDIFLERGYVDMDSPAYFNIIYNPNLDVYDTSIETPDIAYFIVKQNDGYHLISQSMEDAGIHNTKIDIEDFIIEPQVDSPNYLGELDESDGENSIIPPAQVNSRRAKHPRFLNY